MAAFLIRQKQNKPRPKDEWYRVEGTHEPIIDRELWDRVALVAQRQNLSQLAQSVYLPEKLAV